MTFYCEVSYFSTTYSFNDICITRVNVHVSQLISLLESFISYESNSVDSGLRRDIRSLISTICSFVARPASGDRKARHENEDHYLT